MWLLPSWNVLGGSNRKLVTGFSYESNVVEGE